MQTTLSRVGRPEIATDPMGPTWPTPTRFSSRGPSGVQGSLEKPSSADIAEQLEQIPGVASSISQPITFRMMELIEGVGVRSDVAVKIFGDDMDGLCVKRMRWQPLFAKCPAPPTSRCSRLPDCRFCK